MPNSQFKKPDSFTKTIITITICLTSLSIFVFANITMIKHYINENIQKNISSPQINTSITESNRKHCHTDRDLIKHIKSFLYKNLTNSNSIRYISWQPTKLITNDIYGKRIIDFYRSTKIHNKLTKLSPGNYLITVLYIKKPSNGKYVIKCQTFNLNNQGKVIEYINNPNSALYDFSCVRRFNKKEGGKSLDNQSTWR